MSITWQQISITLMAILFSILTTPWIRKLAIKKKIYDVPCIRKKHKVPVPQLGGIALFLGFFLAIVVAIPMNLTLMGLLIGALLMTILGFIDDVFKITPTVKLLGQIVIAIITVKFGIQIDAISSLNGTLIPLKAMAIPFTIFWIISITNALNLMDGVDGLASGISAISSACLAIVALKQQDYVTASIALALMGSCIGFLKFNFAPASIFMGDTGSMFLGYTLATIAIIGVLKSTLTLAFLIPILTLGIPIVDTLLAIIRRIKKKKSIFQADNEHIHHFLLKKGLSPKEVSLMSYLVSTLLGIIAIIIAKV